MGPFSPEAQDHLILFTGEEYMVGDHQTVFIIKGFRNLCFPGGSKVKDAPAMQEMQEMSVQSLGLEDPLEKEMATHSSILAGKIPWMEEPVRL